MNKILYVYCDKEINDFEGLSKVLPLLLKQCYCAQLIFSFIPYLNINWSKEKSIK